ncbi:MAG: helix-turn-helix domain-containing protein [Nitriliruptoraceae bacterium]
MDRQGASPVPDDDPARVRARIAATVRALRQDAGRSLADVALAAGIGKSTLHAIESGEANPGIETLWSLARALDVPFGRLLDVPAPQVRVIRAGSGPRVGSESGAMEAQLLAMSSPGSRTELYVVAVADGVPHPAEPHAPGTIEHVLVTDGLLRAGPRADPVELAKGDFASFPGDVAHAYDAREPETRAVLVIEYRGRG